MSAFFTHDAPNPRTSTSFEPPKQMDAAHMRALADAIEQTMAEGEHDDGMHLGPSDLLACVAALRLTANAGGVMEI